MSTNPEIAWSVSEHPEVQEVIDSTRLSGDSLREEVYTTSQTKSDINKWFSKFFERVQKMRSELKQLHISKAIAIIFWIESGETENKEGVAAQSVEGENSNNQESSWITWTASSTEWIDEKEKEPADDKIVLVKDYIKDIKIDMRYATTNNFTWQKIYENGDAKLRYWTVKKLKMAQDKLAKSWYSIKIWDAYRPHSAQEKLRSIRPDSTLVANPYKWWSSHTRWNTVDITLVKSDWTEIPMPSEFDDDNKKRIDRDYSDMTEEQRKNAKILEDAMKEAWFKWYNKERWHYSDKDTYPLEKGD